MQRKRLKMSEICDICGNEIPRGMESSVFLLNNPAAKTTYCDSCFDKSPTFNPDPLVEAHNEKIAVAEEKLRESREKLIAITKKFLDKD